MARKAKLVIVDNRWMHLLTRNRKIRMHSEQYANKSSAKRAEAQAIQDFIDVLEDRGFTVIPPTN